MGDKWFEYREGLRNGGGTAKILRFEATNADRGADAFPYKKWDSGGSTLIIVDEAAQRRCQVSRRVS
jgi:hypothetical protein